MPPSPSAPPLARSEVRGELIPPKTSTALSSLRLFATPYLQLATSALKIASANLISPAPPQKLLMARRPASPCPRVSPVRFGSSWECRLSPRPVLPNKFASQERHNR